MGNEDPTTDHVGADAESAEGLVDEAPTEEHETLASETQESEVATVELLSYEVDELRAKAAERDDLFDKLQRSKADFINYQKRIQRERERMRDAALQDTHLRILPVLDDLERALGAASKDHDFDALIHGIELIQAKLLKALADDAVVPIEAENKEFDPAFHEAVAHVKNPEVYGQTVVEVLREGYMLGERVLRPPQVVVATGGERRPEPADAEPGGETEEPAQNHGEG